MRLPVFRERTAVRGEKGSASGRTGRFANSLKRVDFLTGFKLLRFSGEREPFRESVFNSARRLFGCHF